MRNYETGTSGPNVHIDEVLCSGVRASMVTLRRTVLPPMSVKTGERAIVLEGLRCGLDHDHDHRGDDEKIPRSPRIMIVIPRPRHGDAQSTSIYSMKRNFMNKTKNEWTRSESNTENVGVLRRVHKMRNLMSGSKWATIWVRNTCLGTRNLCAKALTCPETFRRMEAQQTAGTYPTVVIVSKALRSYVRRGWLERKKND